MILICNVGDCTLQTSSFISNTTAASLLSNGAIGYCLTVLKNLLPYWRNYNPAEVTWTP